MPETTVTEISPAFGHAGDDVTLTGTGFGALGTAGVSIDGRWALVTASSSTGLTFEVPATDTAGVKDLMVGATAGAVTMARAFTVLPDDDADTLADRVLAQEHRLYPKTLAEFVAR